MISEEQARRIHCIDQVKMAQLPIGPDVEWPETPDGLGIKQLYFAYPGIFMGQHAHRIGHAHLVGNGEIRVWVEGVEIGDYSAGQVVNIEAGKRHILMSLKADTRGFCITRVPLGADTVVALSECPA